METLLTWLIAGAVLGFFFIRNWRSHKRGQAEAKAAAEKGALFSDGPKAQHPKISDDYCIGCGACVTVCPEGDVLALIGGKATIINGHKCIGHGLCAEACPVGAITMVMAKPSSGADIPVISEEHETNVENLFIVGELGGLALIKNAVNQGRDCVDVIAERVGKGDGHSAEPNVLDVVIVGAGPAGISASLRASQRGLKALTLEREDVGGTVSKYPRQKLVMTSPVEFPLHGKFNKTALSKEDLLKFWEKIMQRTDLNIHTGEGVEAVKKDADGLFSIRTARGEYWSRAVVLALGRAGTPRKLGVKGEEDPKVVYRLIEADQYRGKHVLVVGGGDSALEAALDISNEPGTHVILSYRGKAFDRVKPKNRTRLAEAIAEKKIEQLLESTVREISTGKVILKLGEELLERKNDAIIVCAGGELPTPMLKKMGIQVDTRYGD